MSIFLETLIYLVAILGIIIATYSMVMFDYYIKPSRCIIKKTLNNINNCNNKDIKKIDIYINNLDSLEEECLTNTLSESKLDTTGEIYINIYRK